MQKTTTQPSAPTTAVAASQPAAPTANGYRLPENNTLQHATKLAIVEDKPVMMDYWTLSEERRGVHQSCWQDL